MNNLSPISERAMLPRVVAVGSYRDPLRLSGTAMQDALARVSDLRHVPASGAPWSAPATLIKTLRAIREHDAELVHVLDGRYAAVGRWIRRRRSLPATVSLSSADVKIVSGWPRTSGGLDRLDMAFVSDPLVAAALREKAPRLDVMMVPTAAHVLPWPSPRKMSGISRTLKGTRAGRLVIGVPWPADRRDLRWFRDAIMPLVDGGPLCLVFGAPGRREARMLFGAQGMQADFRVQLGRLDGPTIAAVARCVDAFVVPSGLHGLNGAATDLGLALAMGGVPVISYGETDARVFAHEQNAFVVEPNESAFVQTVSQVLSLPAIQRHALGEDFARYTLHRWTWNASAEIYGDRFAALVGRPQIPMDLRAAA